MLLAAPLTSGCSFSSPAGAPANLALGAPCAADLECASLLCTASSGSLGECVECRTGTPCPPGRSCELAAGRCMPDPIEPSALRHAPRIGGERRTNAEGRIHVGKVGAVPVTTVRESSR